MIRKLIVAAVVAALLGVVIGGDIGVAFDVAAIVLLTSAPALRLIGLAIAWTRHGDMRYALAAWMLIFLMSTSVIGVAVWR